MVVERSRFTACMLAALAGFILGLALGQLGIARESSRTRIAWPAPAHPRSLEP